MGGPCSTASSSGSTWRARSSRATATEKRKTYVKTGAGAPEGMRARGQRFKNVGIFGDASPQSQCFRAFACFSIPKSARQIPKSVHFFPKSIRFFPCLFSCSSSLFSFSFSLKSERKKKKRGRFMQKRYPHTVSFVTECIPKFSGRFWGNLGMDFRVSACFFYASKSIPKPSPYPFRESGDWKNAASPVFTRVPSDRRPQIPRFPRFFLPPPPAARLFHGAGVDLDAHNGAVRTTS